MNAAPGIIAGGHWIVDHVKLVDGWPRQDELVTIIEESRANGGSPYNVLKDLRKLGASFPLLAVGLIGEDEAGRFIRDDCRRHGIDAARLLTTDRAATSYTDVMTERSTGRRTFFHQPGANALLGPEHFDFDACAARIFHLGYLLLLRRLDELRDGLPAAHDVLCRARARGLKTSLDCVSADGGRFGEVVAPVLPQVDYFFANDCEAERLTGRSLGRGETLDRGAVEQAARALVGLGVREWAIVHFPEGACAASAAGAVVWQPSVWVPAADIRGAAGAGDALAAGVLYGLHEGWPMARCLHLGVCAAASSLYHPTCSESVRGLEQCLELGARLGFRGYDNLPG